MLVPGDKRGDKGMNWKLIFGGGIVYYAGAWLVAMISGPLIHEGVLDELYKLHAQFWRPELNQVPPDMAALMPRWIASGLIGRARRQLFAKHGAIVFELPVDHTLPLLVVLLDFQEQFVVEERLAVDRRRGIVDQPAHVVGQAVVDIGENRFERTGKRSRRFFALAFAERRRRRREDNRVDAHHVVNDFDDRSIAAALGQHDVTHADGWAFAFGEREKRAAGFGVE